MSFDEEFESWKIFKATLRELDKGLFKQMIDEAKEYRKAIESKENQIPEALLMVLILKQQKMINQLMKIQNSDE